MDSSLTVARAIPGVIGVARTKELSVFCFRLRLALFLKWALFSVICVSLLFSTDRWSGKCNSLSLRFRTCIICPSFMTRASFGCTSLCRVKSIFGNIILCNSSPIYRFVFSIHVEHALDPRISQNSFPLSHLMGFVRDGKELIWSILGSRCRSCIMTRNGLDSRVSGRGMP